MVLQKSYHLKDLGIDIIWLEKGVAGFRMDVINMISTRMVRHYRQGLAMELLIILMSLKYMITYKKCIIMY